MKPLGTKKAELNKEEGELNARVSIAAEEVLRLQKELAKIEELIPMRDMKNIEFKNIENEIGDVQYKIGQITFEGYSQEKVEQLIINAQKDINALDIKISNFDKSLRHHISINESIRLRMNTILSEDVLQLDSSYVNKKVSEIDHTVLNIFDGLIDISSIDDKKMVSIEQLNLDLQEKKAVLEKLEVIKENILNYKNLEKHLEELKGMLTKIQNEFDFIDSKDDKNKKLEELYELQNDLKDKQALVEASLQKNVKDIDELNNQKQHYVSIHTTTNEDLKTLERQHRDIQYMHEKYDKAEVTVESIESIDVIFQNIKREEYNIRELSNNKDTQFNLLKYKLNKEFADIEAFIDEIDEDIQNIPEKKESIKTLVESITNETCKPTASFIDELQHFKNYISSINSKLKKYKISNIESIEIKINTNDKLLSELSSIAYMDKQDLFVSEEAIGERMSVLTKYIEQSKKIHISELFDLVFVVDGKERDLSDQVESNGTDIMIKMSLLMLIISNLIVQDEQNKLVLYLDELAAIDDDNVQGFINRAYEHGFVSIFASPDKKTHIDRYYDIYRQGKEKISIDDKRAIDVKDRV